MRATCERLPTVAFNGAICHGPQPSGFNERVGHPDNIFWYQAVLANRVFMALDEKHQALERQPRNWVLLNEIAMFLTFSLRDLKAGIDMAKMALALNPTCSAELWNTLGDGLFEFGRTEEARSAYLKALDVNESDVRARYNLAWCYAREKNFPAALDMISQALALDKTGEYRERLTQKLSEVMQQVGLRHQQEYLLPYGQNTQPMSKSSGERAFLILSAGNLERMSFAPPGNRGSPRNR